jgi:hypothetical protein
MVPIVLLIAGGACVVGGVWFHSLPVLAQIENKQSAVAKDLPGGARPFWMQQGPAVQEAPQYIATVLQESEPQLIQEVTVGGLMLAADGRIQRTYKGFEIPSLCPT